MIDTTKWIGEPGYKGPSTMIWNSPRPEIFGYLSAIRMYIYRKPRFRRRQYPRQRMELRIDRGAWRVRVFKGEGQWFRMYQHYRMERWVKINNMDEPND